MLYISCGSVGELETQILLAVDLGLIEKGVLGRLKKDIAEIERILKRLIKSLENKHLNPWVTWQWLPVETEGARMRRSCPE